MKHGILKTTSLHLSSKDIRNDFKFKKKLNKAIGSLHAGKKYQITLEFECLKSPSDPKSSFYSREWEAQRGSINCSRLQQGSTIVQIV